MLSFGEASRPVGRIERNPSNKPFSPTGRVKTMTTTQRSNDTFSAVNAHTRRQAALEAIERVRGGALARSIESESIDFKEESGTVGRDGVRRQIAPRDEGAARALAEEAACLANSDVLCDPHHRSSMANDFDDLLAQVEAEAEARGPAAVEALRSLDTHFAFAVELVTARRAAKMTQIRLAELSGIPQSEISRFERGQGTPTLETTPAARLARPAGSPRRRARRRETRPSVSGPPRASVTGRRRSGSASNTSIRSPNSSKIARTCLSESASAGSRASSPRSACRDRSGRRGLCDLPLLAACNGYSPRSRGGRGGRALGRRGSDRPVRGFPLRRSAQLAVRRLTTPTSFSPTSAAAGDRCGNPVPQARGAGWERRWEQPSRFQNAFLKAFLVRSRGTPNLLLAPESSPE
jgi:DNA-binding transcriptional regulator YiaG